MNLDATRKGSWVISAPYPEGAVRRLATHLASEGRLESLFTPSRVASRTAARFLFRWPEGAIARLHQDPFAGLPELREVMPGFEVRRLFARVLPRPLQRLGDVPALKRSFDRVVSRAIPRDARVVLGMPEACLNTFQSSSDLIRVFHEVDTHPRAHNDALRRHFLPSSLRRELISEDRVERIEAELAAADLVLSPSTLVTEQLVRFGVAAHRIVQQPYGVDLTTFAPSEQAPRKIGQPVSLLYVGQISRRKGIPMLTDAARRSGSVHITMIGPVVDQELLRNLPESVRYVGVLTQAQLAPFYRSADAFVFPSLEDNFGLVVLEAAGAGLPVVTTTSVGAAELLGDADLRLVPPGDVGRLAEALLSIEPLGESERAERAARIREQGGIVGWAEYATLVDMEITRRLKA